jgi:hypothetical protein
MKQNVFLKWILKKYHSKINTKSDSRLHSMFYNMSLFFKSCKTYFLLDIDECNENGKLCINGQCENTIGSYRCICRQGFQLSPDGAYCLGLYHCNLSILTVEFIELNLPKSRFRCQYYRWQKKKHCAQELPQCFVLLYVQPLDLEFVVALLDVLIELSTTSKTIFLMLCFRRDWHCHDHIW